MKNRVERVYVNREGYTWNGKYFGAGKNVYLITNEDSDDMRYIRAEDRSDALKKAKSIKLDPLRSSFRGASKRLGAYRRSREPESFLPAYLLVGGIFVVMGLGVYALASGAGGA